MTHGISTRNITDIIDPDFFPEGVGIGLHNAAAQVSGLVSPAIFNGSVLSIF
jgi:hypothetical protein